MATNDSSVVTTSVSARGVLARIAAAYRPRRRLGEQRGRAVEHPERHEEADRQEREQLDDRFGGDREHQAVLVLGGVDMARAEQHREGRHRQRDEQRDVAEHRLRHAGVCIAWREDRVRARTTPL